ncbi:MAG: hypothetical protein J6P70_00450, partial [Ruminobacter sp.]|nr:hypothetical protein [Ruminobacter sp.]
PFIFRFFNYLLYSCFQLALAELITDYSDVTGLSDFILSVLNRADFTMTFITELNMAFHVL